LIQSNLKEIEAKIKRDMTRLQRSVFPKAQMFAINKIANKTRTRAVRGISKSFRIKQKLIRKRTKVYTTKRKSIVFRTFVNPMPVKALTPARGRLPVQKKGGIKVAGRKYPHAFVAKGRKGGNVFERKGKARLPIKVVTVPIQPRATKIINTSAKRVASSDYGKELTRQIKRLSHRAAR